MIQEITLFAGSPLHEQRVTLGGEDFVLRFDYSEREDRWYLSVYDAAGASVRRGMKVNCNWDVLRMGSATNRPAGALVFLDTTRNRDSGEAPTFGEFGRTVKLGYLSNADSDAEIAEALAGL